MSLDAGLHSLLIRGFLISEALFAQSLYLNVDSHVLAWAIFTELESSACCRRVIGVS